MHFPLNTICCQASLHPELGMLFKHPCCGVLWIRSDSFLFKVYERVPAWQSAQWVSCAPGQWVPNTEMRPHHLSKSVLRAEPGACSSCPSTQGSLMWVTLPCSTPLLPSETAPSPQAFPACSWFQAVSGTGVQTPLRCGKPSSPTPCVGV